MARVGGQRRFVSGSCTLRPGTLTKSASWVQISVAPPSNAMRAICRSNTRGPETPRSRAGAVAVDEQVGVQRNHGRRRRRSIMAARSATFRPGGRPPSTVTHLMGFRVDGGAPPRRSSARSPCSISVRSVVRRSAASRRRSDLPAARRWSWPSYENTGCHIYGSQRPHGLAPAAAGGGASGRRGSIGFWTLPVGARS